MERGQIPALSGLRAIAALSVVAFHGAAIGMFPSFLEYKAAGIGVALFFVLSGFLMGHLYLWQPFTTGRGARFAQARFARVYPLFAAVVVLSAVLYSHGIPFHYWMSWPEALRHLLLLGDMSVFWTIATEFQFYGAFIALWWWHGGDDRRDLLLAGGLAATSAVVLMVGLGGHWLPAHLHLFSAGVIASIVFRRMSGTVVVKAIAALLPVWVVGYLLLWPGIGELVGVGFGKPFVPVILGLLVLSAAASDTLTARSLGSRVMVFLGDISFGIYLLHFPVLDWWRFTLIAGVPYWLGLACSVAVLLAASRLAYLVIEVPARRALRGLRPAHLPQEA